MKQIDDFDSFYLTWTQYITRLFKECGSEVFHIRKQVTAINSKLDKQPKLRSSNGIATGLTRQTKALANKWVKLRLYNSKLISHLGSWFGNHRGKKHKMSFV